MITYFRHDDNNNERFDGMDRCANCARSKAQHIGEDLQCPIEKKEKQSLKNSGRFIVTTVFRKQKLNWSGTKWSTEAAKVYCGQSEALEALNSYWFSVGYDRRPVIFRPITERRMVKLIYAGKAKL